MGKWWLGWDGRKSWIVVVSDGMGERERDGGMVWERERDGGGGMGRERGEGWWWWDGDGKRKDLWDGGCDLLLLMVVV